MKNSIKYLLILLVGFLSCSEDKIDTWSVSTDNYIKFRWQATYFSFLAAPMEIVQDTVDVQVNLIGNIANYSRAFSLEQITDTIWRYTTNEDGKLDSVALTQAVEGVHFKFPDAASMVIEADSILGHVPLILLRDTSLQKKEHWLRLKLVQKDAELSLLSGDSTNLECFVIFSELLIPPTYWTNNMHGKTVRTHLGEYSFVKHKFVNDVSGVNWDDDFIMSIFMGGGNSAWIYYNMLFKRELEKYNKENGPLLDENKVAVKFP